MACTQAQMVAITYIFNVAPTLTGQQVVKSSRHAISEGAMSMSSRLSIILAFALFAAFGETPAQQSVPADSGKAQCSGTIYGTVVQAYGERKLNNMPVYVFTLAQSRRLREMDEVAYKRAHGPGLAEGADAPIEDQNEAALIDLIPKLPRTAFGKSDSRGAFSFSPLPCGQRYYLASFVVTESGLILAIKITPLLKNAERMKVDLRQGGEGWDERFKAEK